MQQNRRHFHEIISNGSYGRKTAYVDADTVTPDNVLSILAKTIGIFNANKTECQYLWNYKKGDQPIIYRTKVSNEDINNKVCENHAYEIVQFNVAQTYGEPIQYVSVSKDEAVNTAVDMANTFMKNAFKHQRNVEQGEWKSAVGTSYLAIQRTGAKDYPFRIVVPTPLDTYIVYSSYTKEPLMAVQELKDLESKVYYLCFSENMEFKVQNSKLLNYVWSDGTVRNYKLHAFGGIPIVEIPNNQDRLSDIEIVITLLDAINLMQSNRMDGIEQFIQAWVKFVNCEIDKELFDQMKKERALVVKSNNGDNKADVDLMSDELDQTQTQIAKEDLWDNSQSILAIPTKQGNTGGDTQGAVELRNGWDFSKQRAKLKDAFVIEAEIRFARVMLEVLRISGNDLKITTNDFDVNIPHSPQDNMSVKANVLLLLLQAGIHPLIAIRVCGLWNDAEKTYLMSKPYLDVLYKTIDDEIEQIPDAEEQTKKANEIVETLNNEKKQATA